MTTASEVVQSLPHRKTKIVATLGPASFDKLRELILAGVNVFRINFSHATISDEQVKLVQNIRSISEELNVPVGILGDLPGPKVRCGSMKDGKPLNLVKGNKVLLRASDEPGEEGIITTPIRAVVKQLQVGHVVLLDDGTKKLVVVGKPGGPEAEEVECVVEIGGPLKDKKGINVPDIKLGVSALTPVDRKLLTFILEQKLDFVAISFVQRGQDLLDARDHIAEFNKAQKEKDPSAVDVNPLLIAKIEKPQAVDDLDEILEVTDGVMVARGDLGVECSLEKIPVYQKLIIEKANRAGRIVITATQMLESMINASMPTRAEVSDVANAVFDGTDAVMLSAESAAGKYPIEAVSAMASICVTAEEKHDLVRVVPTDSNLVSQSFTFAISEAALSCSKAAQAKAIIVLTSNGTMARLIAKKKSSKPVIAITSNHRIVNQLVILWGTNPILIELPTSQWVSSDHILSYSEQAITARGWLEANDTVVFTSGQHDALAGLTNTLQLLNLGSVSKSLQNRNAWAGLISGVLQKKV